MSVRKEITEPRETSAPRVWIVGEILRGHVRIDAKINLKQQLSIVLCTPRPCHVDLLLQCVSSSQ